MMTFQQRVAACVQLGDFLREISTAGHPKIAEAYIHNAWFTPENQRAAITAWAGQLTRPKLEKWLAAYQVDEHEPKTVAIIMAGNIPLVGFHDLMCVLVSGHKALIRLSEDDQVLPNLLIEELLRIAPGMAEQVQLSESRLPKQFDAVIATGSNNSNRYFEYYFRNKPALLRSNRSSVAVLTGNETPEDLHKLGGDIFTYFGLGCRNVSKLYVPEGYDLSVFFEGIEQYNQVIQHNKYANNYTYHKAIFLLNMAPHLDNNFVLLKRDESIASPLGTVFYEPYATVEQVKEKLREHAHEIQCVVCKTDMENAVPFGKAQSPDLWDYADRVDTMKFLLGL